jgi:uncharacterized protein YjiS (DUF1127 family)
MEIAVNTMSSAPAAAQPTSPQARQTSLLAGMKRWWLDYLTWRAEEAAISKLWAMSDRELKDIGLTRSQIARAVRDEAGRDRATRRYL